MKMVTRFLLAAALCASALAQDKPAEKKLGDKKAAEINEATNVLPKPAPEMERLSRIFVGTWSTSEKHEPGRIAPKGGTGTGLDAVKLGPGGLSLVFDYKSSDPMGKFVAHGVIWWDAQEQGYKGLECTNRSPGGCEVGGLWKWEGNDLVSHEEGLKEVFTDITPTSRTFYMDASTDGGPMKRFMTIKYTKSGGTKREAPKKP